MRSRMPFPDPTLAVVFIAGVIVVVLPLCMRKEVTLQDDHSRIYESYEPQREAEIPRSIVIKTKFVEITSGTEELGFDWIVQESDDPNSNNKQE